MSERENIATCHIIFSVTHDEPHGGLMQVRCRRCPPVRLPWWDVGSGSAGRGAHQACSACARRHLLWP